MRLAARFKRPRHLILVDTSGEGVHDDDRAALNELRRRLDAGELGAEGFQTALRLGGDNPLRAQADPLSAPAAGRLGPDQRQRSGALDRNDGRPAQRRSATAQVM